MQNLCRRKTDISHGSDENILIAGGILICYSKHTTTIHGNEVIEMNTTLKCCLANIVLVILLFLFSVCKLGLSAVASILPGFIALVAANLGIIFYSAKK